MSCGCAYNACSPRTHSSLSSSNTNTSMARGTTSPRRSVNNTSRALSPRRNLGQARGSTSPRRNLGQARGSTSPRRNTSRACASPRSMARGNVNRYFAHQGGDLTLGATHVPMGSGITTSTGFQNAGLNDFSNQGALESFSDDFDGQFNSANQGFQNTLSSNQGFQSSFSARGSPRGRNTGARDQNNRSRYF